MRTIDTPPKASILIESLRDIGYTLETALADVIDNSISAGATEIHLLADSTSAEPSIAILDNGSGMAEYELLSAMRLGSQSPSDVRGKSDLGRFGLGMKTASFSQCRKLTVVTRKDGETNSARWDLDHVVDTDSWAVEIPEEIWDIPQVDRLGETGTLLVWENLDRVLPDISSETDRTNFVRLVDDARKHLELVFHRFLLNEPGLGSIAIYLNNRALKPYDPFHSNHPATLHGPVEKIRVTDGEVVIQPFTLPHHKKVGAEEWSEYAGPEGYLKNQGFYVYRGRRLILHGTWFGLARQLELTKLARVRIDIPNGLDVNWKIDVRKASAQPPYRVKERLRRIIEPLGATSKRVYTTRGSRLIADNPIPVWNRIQDKNEVSYQVNEDHPIIKDFVDRLSPEMQNQFGHLLDVASASLPYDTLYADFGNDVQDVTSNISSEDALQYAVEKTYENLLLSGFSRDETLAMMKAAEPFRSNWDASNTILQRATVEGVTNE